MMKNKRNLEPKEDIDYFVVEKRLYTVCIEVSVTCVDDGDLLDSEVCSKAAEGFQKGLLDGNSEVVSSDLLEKIKVNEDGTPFDISAWREAKSKEIGIKLRPGETQRPLTEGTLEALI